MLIPIVLLQKQLREAHLRVPWGLVLLWYSKADIKRPTSPIWSKVTLSPLLRWEEKETRKRWCMWKERAVEAIEMETKDSSRRSADLCSISSKKASFGPFQTMSCCHHPPHMPSLPADSESIFWNQLPPPTPAPKLKAKVKSTAFLWGAHFCGHSFWHHFSSSETLDSTAHWMLIFVLFLNLKVLSWVCVCVCILATL